MKISRTKQLANAIARDLFTSGFSNKRADRLVLFHEEKSGDEKHNLGGWCETAAADRIERRILKWISAEANRMTVKRISN